MGPGERINLSKLSEQLGVSTTPVRDALDRLCAKGIVVKKTSEHSSMPATLFLISAMTPFQTFTTRESPLNVFLPPSVPSETGALI